MKNESMKQLNALKSCLFSPGAIWSEQQVVSMVKIHVPIIRKTQKFKPSYLSAILTDLKKINLKKN